MLQTLDVHSKVHITIRILVLMMPVTTEALYNTTIRLQLCLYGVCHAVGMHVTYYTLTIYPDMC